MSGLLEIMLQIGRFMKRFIFISYILILLILFFSCTTEPTESEYSVKIKNTSEQIIVVKSFFNGNLLNETNLISGEKGLSCIYSSEFFLGYKLSSCKIDSLVFKFSNNKGYISSINYISEHDFPNNYRPFLSNPKFIEVNNNTFEFIINQEDYENAHELPE